MFRKVAVLQLLVLALSFGTPDLVAKEKETYRLRLASGFYFKSQTAEGVLAEKQNQVALHFQGGNFFQAVEPISSLPFCTVYLDPKGRPPIYSGSPSQRKKDENQSIALVPNDEFLDLNISQNNGTERFELISVHPSEPNQIESIQCEDRSGQKLFSDPQTFEQTMKSIFGDKLESFAKMPNQNWNIVAAVLQKKSPRSHKTSVAKRDLSQIAICDYTDQELKTAHSNLVDKVKERLKSAVVAESRFLRNLDRKLLQRARDGDENAREQSVKMINRLLRQNPELFRLDCKQGSKPEFIDSSPRVNQQDLYDGIKMPSACYESEGGQISPARLANFTASLNWDFSVPFTIQAYFHDEKSFREDLKDSKLRQLLRPTSSSAYKFENRIEVRFDDYDGERLEVEDDWNQNASQLVEPDYKSFAARIKANCESAQDASASDDQGGFVLGAVEVSPSAGKDFSPHNSSTRSDSGNTNIRFETTVR